MLNLFARSSRNSRTLSFHFHIKIDPPVNTNKYQDKSKDKSQDKDTDREDLRKRLEQLSQRYKPKEMLRSSEEHYLFENSIAAFVQKHRPPEEDGSLQMINYTEYEGSFIINFTLEFIGFSVPYTIIKDIVGLIQKDIRRFFGNEFPCDVFYDESPFNKKYRGADIVPKIPKKDIVPKLMRIAILILYIATLGMPDINLLDKNSFPLNTFCEPCEGFFTDDVIIKNDDCGTSPSKELIFEQVIIDPLDTCFVLKEQQIRPVTIEQRIGVR